MCDFRIERYKFRLKVQASHFENDAVKKFPLCFQMKDTETDGMFKSEEAAKRSSDCIRNGVEDTIDRSLLRVHVSGSGRTPL